MSADTCRRQPTESQIRRAIAADVPPAVIMSEDAKAAVGVEGCNAQQTELWVATGEPYETLVEEVSGALGADLVSIASDTNDYGAARVIVTCGVREAALRIDALGGVVWFRRPAHLLHPLDGCVVVGADDDA